MRLAPDSQQFDIRHRWGAESKCNDWVKQEVTPNYKGQSNPVLGYYSGVFKLSYLERRYRQLTEPR